MTKRAPFQRQPGGRTPLAIIVVLIVLVFTIAILASCIADMA